jgi:recombination associated protein RdgC
LFKNLTVYRIAPAWPGTLAEIETTLSKTRFIECGSTQPASAGWVPPRGQAEGRLAEAVGGQWLLTLMVERKLLPATVVQRRVEELAQQLERETGRKPGRKRAREMKDQATLELLPQAFTKRATFKVWLAPKRRLLMVDAASAARADEVVTLLVQAFDGLAVTPVQTAMSPAACMAQWLLSGEPPPGFSVDRECELKSDDEMKSVVRYARHRLDTEEVRQHITAGKRPTKLALTWHGRVSFALTDAGQIRKLDFLDVVFEDRPSRADPDEAFDADAAIATGELLQLIPDLLDALGGEQTPAAPASELPKNDIPVASNAFKEAAPAPW